MTEIQLTPARSNLASAQPLSAPAVAFLSRFPSKESRRTMRLCLRKLISLLTRQNVIAANIELTFPWENLRREHTLALRQKLIENYAPATVNRHLSALRGVLKEAWRCGKMGVEDYQRAADIANLSFESLPTGRDISDVELRRLLQSCDETPLGVRDRAILALLAMTGVRRDELASANLSDYDPASGALRILQGKGRKARTVYVLGAAQRFLQAWLRLRGLDEGALFTSIRRGGHVGLSRLPASRLWAILQTRADACGLAHLTPHDFRRTFVGKLLDAGVDEVTVTKLTGHASVDMLKKYDRRGEAVKRNAIERLDVMLGATWSGM